MYINLSAIVSSLPSIIPPPFSPPLNSQMNCVCVLQAKGHALFVDMDQFRDPTHFGKIMGYNDDISNQQQNNNKTNFELNPDDLAKKEDSKAKHWNFI